MTTVSMPQRRQLLRVLYCSSILVCISTLFHECSYILMYLLIVICFTYFASLVFFLHISTISYCLLIVHFHSIQHGHMAAKCIILNVMFFYSCPKHEVVTSMSILFYVLYKLFSAKSVLFLRSLPNSCNIYLRFLRCLHYCGTWLNFCKFCLILLRSLP